MDSVRVDVGFIVDPLGIFVQGVITFQLTSKDTYRIFSTSRRLANFTIDNHHIVPPELHFERHNQVSSAEVLKLSKLTFLENPVRVQQNLLALQTEEKRREAFSFEQTVG